MNKPRMALALAVVVMIVASFGCSSNRPMYGGAKRPPILNAKRLPAFDYTTTNAPNYYLNGLAAMSDDAQKKRRNEVLNDLMGIIDYNYYEFEDNLRGDKTTQELAADIATLGLTAAATVVGGAETKTILSAIATGVVGVNSSIDKEVFQNNTVQALQLQMRSKRAEIEAKLNRGMNQTVSTYPLENGIRDVVEYYHAGSVTEALLGLVQTAGAAAKTNQMNATAARSTH